VNAGQHNTEIRVSIVSEINDQRKHEFARMNFDKPNIQQSFPNALLGRVLYTLQKCPRNQPLLFCASSDVLLRILVKDRNQNNEDITNPSFDLLQAVIAALKEHSARVQFKKIASNPAKCASNSTMSEIEIETEVDVSFNSPGILLSGGTQRHFTQIINGLTPIPHRKTTSINLERIRCAVQGISNLSPTDEMIWKSIRASTFQRLTREFYWMCLHNIFRVGYFWDHIPHSENFGHCHVCEVPKTLEHIALECRAPEQSMIWDLTVKLWSRTYLNWPKLNWGLQPLSVPKAQIRKMPFWAFSDPRDRFTHISTDSTQIEMKHS
jgi:hypothetical protein